jgi:hypothetical protein
MTSGFIYREVEHNIDLAKKFSPMDRIIVEAIEF